MSLRFVCLVVVALLPLQVSAGEIDFTRHVSQYTKNGGESGVYSDSFFGAVLCDTAHLVGALQRPPGLASCRGGRPGDGGAVIGGGEAERSARCILVLLCGLLASACDPCFGTAACGRRE